MANEKFRRFCNNLLKNGTLEQLEYKMMLNIDSVTMGGTDYSYLDETPLSNLEYGRKDVEILDSMRSDPKIKVELLGLYHKINWLYKFFGSTF